MIPSNLESTFGTLSVGSLAVVVLLALAWLWLAPRQGFVRWLSSGMTREPSKAGIVVPLLVVLALYSFGTILEDISDNLSDTHETSTLSWPPFVPKEGQRVEALFRSTDPLELTPLGAAVFANENFSKLAKTSDACSKSLARLAEASQGTLLSGCGDRPFQQLADTYYFPAKNWVYSKSTYFEELSGIQRRIDFARTSYYLASTLLLLATPTAFSVLWWRRKSGIQKRGSVTIAWMITGLLFIAVTAQCAWRKSEKNFNQRVYGYFHSALEREAAKVLLND